MRAMIVIGAAVLVSACVGSKERVTLLDPAYSANSSMSKSGVVVIDPDGAKVELGTAYNQALLCGDNCEPRIRELGGPRTDYHEVMDILPREEVRVAIMFAEGSSVISQEQVEYLANLLAADEAAGPRPGRQIIVRAFTDSVGAVDANMALAKRRAESVVDQLTQAGFPETEIEAEKDGETTAAKLLGDNVENAGYRKVEIIIR